MYSVNWTINMRVMATISLFFLSLLFSFFRLNFSTKIVRGTDVNFYTEEGSQPPLERCFRTAQ